MALFKRGKIWWMSFFCEGQRIRKSTETTNKKLADAILAKVKVNIIEGRYFDTLEEEENERSFDELMEKYLNEISINKTPRSERRDATSLQHLSPFFGGKTLAQITPKLISAYKVTRREEGAAASTTNKELGMLRHAFNIAIKDWEWCRETPFHRVSLERVDNKRVRYLTDEEFTHLVSFCPNWLRPIVLVARYTGIRRNNIAELRWQQVDLKRKMIILDHTKNGDCLGMPICETLMEVFRELDQVRHQSGYVFVLADGSRCTADSISMAFRRACEKAEILNFRFHDLRHFFASSLVQKNVDLFRVQKLLGHRDSRMTQRYAHLNPENLREAISVLDQD